MVFLNEENQDDDHLSISFSDTGSGLDPESRAKIFDPFYSRQHSTANSGLGMAIIYNLIRYKLAGEIKIMDTTIGTHFQLRFPKQISPASSLHIYD